MKGRVLQFDYKNRRGVVQDQKGYKYNFHIGEWLSDREITIGEEVNFEIPIVEEAINIRAKERFSCFKSLIKKFKSIRGEKI